MYIDPVYIASKSLRLRYSRQGSAWVRVRKDFMESHFLKGTYKDKQEFPRKIQD